MPRTKPNGEVNEAHFRRLKNKLGTISVPTGEIEYQGAEAYLVGEKGEGFRAMAEMMNFERLTNATGAVGVMGRALLEAKVHAADREAFGDAIDEYPLMCRDLVDMTVDYEAAAAFSFEAARLLDERERQAPRGDAERASRERSDPWDEEDDSAAYKLMRPFIPVAKYKTARMAVDTTSYAMEVLGGNGYVREHTTERLLRDAQVLPIREGPSNILALDTLRALNREDAHEALLPYVDERLGAVEHPFLEEPAAGGDRRGPVPRTAGRAGDAGGRGRRLRPVPRQAAGGPRLRRRHGGAAAGGSPDGPRPGRRRPEGAGRTAVRRDAVRRRRGLRRHLRRAVRHEGRRLRGRRPLRPRGPGVAG